MRLSEVLLLRYLITFLYLTVFYIYLTTDWLLFIFFLARNSYLYLTGGCIFMELSFGYINFETPVHMQREMEEADREILNQTVMHELQDIW